MPAIHLAALLAASAACGQIGSTYTQNFDTLATTGTSNAWTQNSTLPSWYAYATAGGNVASYRAGDGTGNAGDLYSYGVSGSSNRSLGAIGSGSFSGYWAYNVTNNSGTTLDRFTVGYDGEQWRKGGGTAAQTMNVQFGFGSTFAGVVTWTSLGAGYSFTSPINTSGASSLDGHLTANRIAGLGGTVTGLAWANGQSIWLRFVEVDDAGNDHALAIDNFSFFAPVPEPGTLALLGLAGLGAAALRRRTA